MGKPRVAPRPRSPQPAAVVPIRPPTHLEGQYLDELVGVVRGVRLLDLAMQGLNAISRHSMIDGTIHLDPLIYAVGDLHTALNKLESRLHDVMIPIPRETAKSA